MKLLDRLALWMFDDREITRAKRYTAFGLGIGLLVMVVWLVIGQQF